VFRQFTAKCRKLIDVSCVKIALPQDEFLHAHTVDVFVKEFGVTHLLTNAEEREWPLIHCDIDRSKVQLRTVLTGYVDPETSARLGVRIPRSVNRPIDIGYRAWRPAYWLGSHALHKARVAEVVDRAAKLMGLQTDISLREEDVFSGEAWLEFLLRCRATIGVEGGATVLDREGKLKERVEAYLMANPTASFEQTREACFPGEDGRINFAVITPRHLEACMTRTCQILIEGHYNGILKPWRHYIPLSPDYSDVEQALTALRDGPLVNAIVENAFAEIACAPSLAYPAFVRDIECTIIEPRTHAEPCSLMQYLTILWLDVRDFFAWVVVRFDRWLLGRQGSSRRRLVRRVVQHLSLRKRAC
jgi:hypothetical protein